MEISHNKFLNKAKFEFGEESPKYTVQGKSGSQPFSVEYDMDQFQGIKGTSMTGLFYRTCLIYENADSIYESSFMPSITFECYPSFHSQSEVPPMLHPSIYNWPDSFLWLLPPRFRNNQKVPLLLCSRRH